MAKTAAKKRTWWGKGVGGGVLVLGLVLGIISTGWGQPPTLPKPVVDSPKVPEDVSIPPGFSGNPIAFFDDYSWRAFIAVVWPGLKDQQGEPDPKKSLDDAGPRVFETYKSLAEVFHNDGSAPAALNQYDDPKYNPCGIKTGYGDLTLASFSKFSNLGQAGFGSLLGPLVAQNTSYVRYQTGFNNIEFQQIVGQQWYRRSNLPNPPGSITFANGALDVKSAWILMKGVPHPERYYVRQAHVLDPVTGQTSQVDVGLVGLHIVQKTPSRPQWIWSSFEQVDNVPPAQDGGPGTFTFNDGKGTPMPSNNPYPLDRVLQPPTAAPFNVQRLKPIHSSTEKTNEAYHAALDPKSVWQFYQLVVTQWPTTPNNPALPGTPNNTFPGSPPNDQTAFANVTMETFEQQTVFTSCMACHNATMKPTDFVWTVADHAFPAKTGTPNLLMQDQSFRKLRDILLDAKKENAKRAPSSEPNGPDRSGRKH
ncbi:MAG: hypothetical protein JO112_07070 [Planctomycetes bacterium]|nr:hypothetical protein [Planctomycetota bacterium]